MTTLAHIPHPTAPKEAKLRTVHIPLVSLHGQTLFYVTVDGVDDGDCGVVFAPEQAEKLEELREWVRALWSLPQEESHG